MRIPSFVRSAVLILTVCSGSLPGIAQVSGQGSTRQTPEELRKELQETRALLVAIQARLGDLERRLESTEPTKIASDPPTTGRPMAARVVEQAVASQAERASSKLSVPLGTGRATLYGQVYLNASFNSGSTNFTDVPTFSTFAAAPFAGRGNFNVYARQTRFGARFEDFVVGSAKARGVVEADFFGGFAPIGNGQNFNIVRLRLAYARLDWQKTSFEVGQDWLLFAPLNPNSLASAAIPDFASAGNLWHRLPQIRIEHRRDFSGGQVKLEGAIVAPASGDFPAGAYVFNSTPSSGDRSEVPYFQSRVSLTPKQWWVEKKQPAFGVSTHYGRARLTGNRGEAGLDSLGVAADWSVPLGAGLAVVGEAFFGRNLAAMQGGILQGTNTDFAVRSGEAITPLNARSIGTRGGWVQLSFTPARFDKLTLNGGFGLDDPRDADLATVSGTDVRLRNAAAMFNFIHKLSPNLSWGVEYRRLDTTWLVRRKLSNDHVNLGFLFSF